TWSAPDAERLPDYASLDVNVSKIWAFTEALNVIGFASWANVLNRRNVRAWQYDADYAGREADLFGQRVFFVGAVLNF
ncbi:MAG: hypothetical protein WBA12_00270, partial [Catalinimonas sp.]